MAFGSSQPFCHSTLSGQTDTDTHTHTHTHTHTQTDRWDKQQVYANSAYAVLYSQRATR